MNRLYQRWTEKSTEVLRKMFDAGCTLEEMTEVLRRPQRAIRCKLQHLGLRLSERPCETIEPDMEAFERVMKLRTGPLSEA